MASLVHGDLESIMQLRVGLVTSANKYASEANLLRSAAGRVEQSSDTNTHEQAAEDAVAIAMKLEGVSAAIDSLADSLTPEIDRLSALVELTRRR
jgi:hypothetical protein